MQTSNETKLRDCDFGKVKHIRLKFIVDSSKEGVVSYLI